VNGRELAVARGWDDTRATLRRWNAAPGAVLRPWLAVSLAVTAALLVGTWLIALGTTPDPSGHEYAGVTRDATAGDAAFFFGRNLLVLALHALACLAGFIAKSSLPLEATDYSGAWRWIHDRAGSAAIAFVGAATVFSLGTQAYALGSGLSTLSAQWDTAPGLLLLGVLPHALPELVALFLPLAAWLVAARAERWEELMAATFVTTAIALPVVALAAIVEVTFTPWLLEALHFV